AAFALGASGVQMGTAYLLCPEARISAYHRAALKSARDNLTAMTNVLTGRPARVFMNRIVREIGPLADGVPAFPLASAAVAPVRKRIVAANDIAGVSVVALYMVLERFRNADAAPVYRRFRERGRMAPEGLNYISSWVTDDLSMCYQVMETADRALLEDWMSRW